MVSQKVKRISVGAGDNPRPNRESSKLKLFGFLMKVLKAEIKGFVLRPTV